MRSLGVKAVARISQQGAGAITRRGATFLKYCIRCMQQPGAKREMGGQRFEWGGRAPLVPPLATTLLGVS